MKKAFTLIELLVVIAIIAILAAILFPVFSQAKKAAKKAADLSNFNQIGKAIMLYANDNDDKTLIDRHEEGINWYEPLYSYVKSRDVFRTPAYSRKALFDGETGLNVEPASDYSLNGLFSHGESMTAASKPAEQILLALRSVESSEVDYHPWPASAYTDAATPDWDDLSKYVGTDSPGEPEDDWFQKRLALKPWETGSNFGFLDGHSKFFRWEQTVQAPLPGLHNVDRKIERVNQ
jgi:prepilin-type N-terminal cleavage/methylation domain-containing protein/prepilin-type processing-associated H-X9-DG protein